MCSVISSIEKVIEVRGGKRKRLSKIVSRQEKKTNKQNGSHSSNIVEPIVEDPNTKRPSPIRLYDEKYFISNLIC